MLYFSSGVEELYRVGYWVLMIVGEGNFGEGEGEEFCVSGWDIFWMDFIIEWFELWKCLLLCY